MSRSVSQKSDIAIKRNIIRYSLYSDSIKKWYRWTYLQKRNRLIENRLMVTSGEGWGEGIFRESEVVHTHVHTAVFKMDNQKGPSVYLRELCLMLCGSLDGSGVWGRMDTCVMYGWVSLLCTWNHHNIVNWLYFNIKKGKNRSLI